MFSLVALCLHHFVRDYNHAEYRISYVWLNICRAFCYLAQNNQGLSLLSTPTHLPAFIKPTVLLDRLLSYQEKNVAFDFTDLALALARTPKTEDVVAPLIDKITNPYLKEILHCHFGLVTMPETTPPLSWLEEIKSEDNVIKNKLDILKSDLENKLTDTENILSKNQFSCNAIKASNWQAWRGLWATSVLTTNPNIILDKDHEYAKLYDKVVFQDTNIDYDFLEIFEYDYSKRKWVGTGRYDIWY